jgi:hypothetical protein
MRREDLGKIISKQSKQSKAAKCTLSCTGRFVLSRCAISGIRGSSGFGSVSSEEMERSTLEMVSAGLQLSLRISRQMPPPELTCSRRARQSTIKDEPNSKSTSQGDEGAGRSQAESETEIKIHKQSCNAANREDEENIVRHAHCSGRPWSRIESSGA